MTLGRWITACSILAGTASLAFYLHTQDVARPSATPVANFSAPFIFGRFNVPADNPLTEEAFELGRRLFYDPILSGSNQVACAKCHLQNLAFTDGLPKAIGIAGQELALSSMSLANLLWGQRQFFWNGRAKSLEEQALMPIQNVDEMNQDLDELVLELENIAVYRTLFGRAFGEISPANIAKALATFMRLLISSNSKYDRFLRGELKLSPLEEHGRKLFMAHPDVKVSLRGGNCIDCHSQFLTSGFRDRFDGFSNNGLDGDEELDEGLQEVTKDPAHRGLFKVPTLRNIAVTAPYMHDGRLETLKDVLDHYNNGIRISETLSPLIFEADNVLNKPTRAVGLNLNADEANAIIAFLHTLTDEQFLTHPKFSNPFKEED